MYTQHKSLKDNTVLLQQFTDSKDNYKKKKMGAIS